MKRAILPVLVMTCFGLLFSPQSTGAQVPNSRRPGYWGYGGGYQYGAAPYGFYGGPGNNAYNFGNWGWEIPAYHPGRYAFTTNSTSSASAATVFYGANSGGSPDRSYYASRHAAPNSGGNLTKRWASIRVQIPDPNAQVWFNGAPTQQRGTERLFYTPPLAEGNHSYEVRATWTDNGKEFTRAQTVQVSPGGDATIDFVARQNQDHP